MSRHSKWAKIKRGKSIEDAKRGAVFTKLTRAITLAAREKGVEPATNFKLRIAVDAARAENMPKENIERAIARVSGASEGVNLEEMVYEAIGPGGVTFVIDIVTDNRNRTSGNIKHILIKQGGTIASPGSVIWQFEHKGVFRIASENLPKDKDDFELSLIDAGAQDVKEEEDGLTVYVAPEKFAQMSDFLSSQNIKIDFSGIEWIPKDTIKIEDAAIREKLDELYESIDEDDDVIGFATNEA